MLQHPVPDRILTRIGDITVSFAMLEHTLQFLAWELLADEQRIGQVVTAELSFRRLLTLTASLAIERKVEATNQDALQKLLGRAGDLAGERDRITHSFWGAGEKGKVTRAKRITRQRTGLGFDAERMDEDDLRTVADKMKKLAGDVQDFTFKLAEGQSQTRL